MTSPASTSSSVAGETRPHSRLGVSSWSLNQALTRGDFPLIDLPEIASRHGLGKIEICHFHLPTTDPGYLSDVRGACSSAGVEMYTLLKDSGDITHPDPGKRERDFADIEEAIGIAGRLGAARIRIGAGNAEATPDTLRISADTLVRLADIADDVGVHVVTENWHKLLDTPDAVIEIMERTNGRVGLKLDFGNWSAPRKYDDLAKIAPLAECTHAKADFPTAGHIDRDDYVRCLEICAAAKFAGPHILIFASPGDEWVGLDMMREITAPYAA